MDAHIELPTVDRPSGRWRPGKLAWWIGVLLFSGLIIAGLANDEWRRVLSNGRML